jgi:hypothetical protein
MYVALRDWLRRMPLLEKLGQWSVLVFLVNALVRDELLPYATTWDRELGYSFLTLLVSFGVAAFLHFVLFAAPRSEHVAPNEVYEVERESGTVTLAR